MEDLYSWHLKYEPCFYSKRLINKLATINKTVDKPVNIIKVKKAIYYAKKYHFNQKRQSGEPYYSHPLEVAYMISDYLFRTDIIVSSVLHDTIEDTNLTFEMIGNIFGDIIANQVMDLTRIKGPGIKISSAEMIESLWLQKKYDALLIKQFDRLHNMQTIGVKSPEKTHRIVQETLKYFFVLSEVMEIPTIADIFYNLCYGTNIKLGLISKNNFVFDKQFNFLDSLFPENKIR